MAKPKDTAAGRFEFVVTAGARARQLLAGSTPRVDVAGRKKTTVARQEVLVKAVQKIERAADVDPNE